MLANNLIIGNTSQLSYFFPSNFERISSRDLNFEKICSKKYDRIFLLFAEQRTFLNENEDFFNKINFDYTLSIINKLKDYCNYLVVYSTSELWNKQDGCISLETPYNYSYSPYIKSKELLCNYINNNRDIYSNVIIIYPFNFNSIYRKDGFLFGKIFKSILNNEKVTIGNIDFKRDLTHPKIVVDLSLSSNKDMIVGSGKLINVKKFVLDIFDKLDKNINDYILFDEINNLKTIRNEYYSCQKTSDYNKLIDLTIYDIRNN